MPDLTIPTVLGVALVIALAGIYLFATDPTLSDRAWRLLKLLIRPAPGLTSRGGRPRGSSRRPRR